VSPHSGFAPAKVNLFLHVGAPGEDGYHPIVSLMAFADVGDELVASPADAMTFMVDGPFAGGLGDEGDNLVVRARDALLALAEAPPASFNLRLTKNLPIASGLGGGSADAAAALRLIGARLHPRPSPAGVEGIARALGADVAACLRSIPVLAQGRGDVLKEAPRLPALHAVLVNPLTPTPTAEVYRAYDETPSAEGADLPAAPSSIGSVAEVVEFLSGCRNDLQAPAVRLRPRIGDALRRLAAQPETLLARMSGSGATCFALCEDAAAAARLESSLKTLEPSWWVTRTILAGPAAP
jgi:4-diphosphocytidyl-2-C-methyl-D-erythritol kinase